MKRIFSISIPITLILSIILIYSCKKDKPTPPIITTTAISEITQIAAASGGNVTSDGGATVTARGVCWCTTTGPTTTLSTKTTDGAGTGIFTSSITALTGGTVYYVRAYATNSIGTAYGNEIIITTIQSTFAFEFKISNLPPPTDYYEIKEGSCGESVLWTILQYFRKDLSQEEINKIGGNPGRGLHSNEMILVLDSLKIPFRERKKEATWESTVDTLANIIKRGNPVILGVKIYPDKFPQWYCDHFILLTGTNTKNKFFFYNSFTVTDTIKYIKLCNTEDGYSLVNKYDGLFAIEIILPN